MHRPGPLSRLLLCVFLQFGALAGLPMRPEEIRDLLRAMNQPKIVRELPDENDAGGPGR